MKKIAVFGIGFVFLLILGGLLFYNLYVIKDVRSLNMYFEIVDDSRKVGFNLDSDAIYFGKASLGGIARREVVIDNNYNFPLRVSIKTEGNIKQMVSVSENNFYLPPNQTKYLTYYAIAGETPAGNYTGKTTIVFRRIIFP